MDTIMKNVKYVESNTKTEILDLHTQTLKKIEHYTIFYFAIKITKRSLMKF